MINIIEPFLKYRRILIVLIAACFTQFIELTVLLYKYDLFSGGFLQPYSYLKLDDRLLFIAFSLWFDITLFSLLTSLWFFITDKLQRYGFTIYYILGISLIFIIGIWVAIKFAILSYFNDAINIQLIRNLGGGSLKDSLLYITNEITIFVIIFVAFLIIAYYFNILVKKNKILKIISEKEIDHYPYSNYIIALVIITPFITYAISNNSFIRYGLEKKISYRLISNLLDTLSDFDLDGYGSFAYPKDKTIFNANIHPGALDIPGNGIDEDGFLGDAITQAQTKDNVSELPTKTGKNILLIVLESTRADVLNKQINSQVVAPVLNKLAQSGTAVKYAYSHTGYTVTSLNALFNRELTHTKSKLGLLPFLKSVGYNISIISGQDESFGNVANGTGMKLSGNYYFDARTAINDRVFPSTDSGSLRLSEERVVEAFQKRVQQIDPQQAQFFYVNFQAAHFPYAHPNMQKRLISSLIPRSKITLENKSWVEDSYWNAVANADWAVGKVLEGLSERNLLNHTTIVILGDHGESLFDDGFLGHGHALNDFQTKIPLIINDPSIRVEEPLGQTDVAELLLKSAFELPNQWLSQDKRVFQFVGTLAQPTLIAHVHQNGIRTLFDFRSEQVFLSDLQLWKPYSEALTDNSLKERVINLIRDWESLCWQDAQAKIKNR